MDLFDSGLVEPGDPSYSVTFTAAATYPVVCTLHVEMVGRIRVPMRTSPRDGTTSGPFGVIWASERPAEGSVVDVQVRRPGRSWTTWRSGVETTHDRFHPTSDGTYRFRSSLRATLPDASAGWSDVISVRVRG
jgi:hypothetical protein